MPAAAHPGPVPARRWVPLAVTGTLLLAASILLAVLAVGSAAGAFRGALQLEPVPSGSAAVELEPGTWALYELQDGISGSLSEGDPVTLQASDVKVTGPLGEVQAEAVRGTETFTSGEEEYLAFAHFDVLEPGSYEILVDTQGETVVLSRSVGDTFRNLVPVFLLGGSSLLAGILGAGLLAAGLVRRYRSSRGPSAYAPPGGGYGPAPGGWAHPSQGMAPGPGAGLRPQDHSGPS